jgi:hypothetical protein
MSLRDAGDRMALVVKWIVGKMIVQVVLVEELLKTDCTLYKES